MLRIGQLGMERIWTGRFQIVPGSIPEVGREVRMPTNQPRELADSAEGGG